MQAPHILPDESTVFVPQKTQMDRVAGAVIDGR